MSKKQRFLTKDFWKKQNFIKELTVSEHIVFWLSIAIVNAIFIIDVWNNYWRQTPYLTFAASLINVCSVMSCAKKKPISQIYSFAASLILAPVAWVEHTYAIMIMYWINVVIAVVSFFTWSQNIDNNANMTPKSLKWWQILVHSIVVIGLIAGYTVIEGLQSYQDFMAGKHVEQIPPLHLRIFDSSALMITLSLCAPLIMRLNNILPLYLLLNIAQICTWSCKVATDTAYWDAQYLNAWMMIANNLAFFTMNIFGLINWNKAKIDKLNKNLKKKVA